MEQPINNREGTTQPLNETPVVGSPPQDRRASDAAQDRRMSDEWGKSYQMSTKYSTWLINIKMRQRSLLVVSRNAKGPSTPRLVPVMATLREIIKTSTGAR